MYTCIHIHLLDSDSPSVCFKNCTEREIKKVCGSDGRWYENTCHLRQKNCYPVPVNRVRLEKDEDVCLNGKSYNYIKNQLIKVNDLFS